MIDTEIENRRWKFETDISMAKSKFSDTLIMSVFYALMALCLSGSTLAQIVTSGDCPDVQVQENFNITRNMGRWYEQARFYTLFELGTDCTYFDYVEGSENITKVISNGRYVLFGTKRSFEADVIIPDPEQPAKLLIKIPLSPIELYDNLFALGSDYDNWTVFYSCTPLHGMNVQYAWVLTRKKIPDASILNSAYAVLTKNKIDTTRLTKTNRKTCPE